MLHSSISTASGTINYEGSVYGFLTPTESDACRPATGNIIGYTPILRAEDPVFFKIAEDYQIPGFWSQQPQFIDLKPQLGYGSSLPIVH